MGVFSWNFRRPVKQTSPTQFPLGSIDISIFEAKQVKLNSHKKEKEKNHEIYALIIIFIFILTSIHCKVLLISWYLFMVFVLVSKNCEGFSRHSINKLI